MEKRYGRANRIWCGNRGMMSKANIEFMESGNRRYIIGASKGTLRKFERQLLDEDWRVIREGLEVEMCPSPDGGKETYILCRSRDRREKEKAMHERFEFRIGKIMAKNSRAAGLYNVTVKDVDGRAVVSWQKSDAWREWATLGEGCYLLRTNVTDWSAKDFWQGYIQLREAEAAFRIHKSDLQIRPVWHQTEEGVQAQLINLG